MLVGPRRRRHWPPAAAFVVMLALLLAAAGPPNVAAQTTGATSATPTPTQTPAPVGSVVPAPSMPSSSAAVAPDLVVVKFKASTPSVERAGLASAAAGELLVRQLDQVRTEVIQVPPDQKAAVIARYQSDPRVRSVNPVVKLAIAQVATGTATAPATATATHAVATATATTAPGATATSAPGATATTAPSATATSAPGVTATSTAAAATPTNTATGQPTAQTGTPTITATATSTAQPTPSDTLYAQQWGLQQVGWPQAWRSLPVTGAATIAVLDTGVDATHPDLAGRVLPGQSFTGGNPNADPNGHGTAMAGIAAADANNALGIAGVAYAGASVLPVQVLGADGAGYDSEVASGVLWAADHGAKVILLAMSSPTYSPLLADAVTYAWQKGAVVVAATGNDGGSAPTYPAGLPNVIGAAATNQSGMLATFSNTGDVAVAAPGVGIQTLAPGSGYQVVSGTSAASAMVAGEAALLLARGESNAVAANQIRAGTDPLAGRTFGLIDLPKALGALLPPVATATPFATPTVSATPVFHPALLSETVLGQTSFTGTASGASASTMASPEGVAVDSVGNVYIADPFDNRVLYFPGGSGNGASATKVFGQLSLTTGTTNTTPSTMSHPEAVAVDSSDNLYVADTNNSRVLYFPAGSAIGASATGVFGQPDLISGTPNNGGISSRTLASPGALALDSSNNLYIADTGNNRVLFFPAGSVSSSGATATKVFGQAAFNTSATGVTASTMATPIGVAAYGAGNLYVGDQANNRVLFFPSGSLSGASATKVFGQPDLVTGTPNTGGISGATLSAPHGVAADSSGNLYVADDSNNRILYFPAGSSTGAAATRVYGQASFTGATGGVTASSVNTAIDVAVDSAANLYVADYGNSRVLINLPLGLIPPGVTAVSPAAGPLGGGASVTITGSGFSGATAVKFGATNATGFTVNSDTQITATSPAGTGAVDITVTTPVGTSAVSAADQFAHIVNPYALQFNGASNQYVQVAAPATAFHLTTGAWEAWIFPTWASGSPPGGGNPAIIGKRTGGSNQYSIHIHNNYTGVDIASNGSNTTWTTPITPNVWTHLAYVQAGSSATLYLNGVSQGTNAYTLNTNAVADQPFNIGQSGAGGSELFTGSIDEVRVWNVARTQAQIQASYQQELNGNETGLVGYWRLDEGPGNAITANTTGNAAVNPGTLVNGPTWTTSAAPLLGPTAPPVVTSLSSLTGSTAGGQIVTIAGTGFTAVTGVKFGATAATSLAVNSSTSISALAPSDSAGVVDVTVTTLNGTSATSPADHYIYTGSVSAALSTVGATPGTATADGTSSSTITVTLLDALSHPVSGKTVTLSQGAGSSNVSAASGASSASGIVTFAVADSHLESVTYTAIDSSDANLTIGLASVTFAASAVSPIVSTVEAAPGTVTADGTSSSTITVTLLDALSHPVSGETVTLSQGAGSSNITGGGVTNASGVVTFTITDTSVESVTYTATDSTGTLALSSTVAVTFVASPTVTPSPTNTPAPSGTTTQPAASTGTDVSGGSAVNSSGSASVNAGAASASGGASIVGPQAPNTGVADIPAGFTVPAATAPGVVAAPPVDPASITGAAPAAVSAVVSAATGGIVLAGNVAVVLSPAALSAVAGGQLTVSVQPNPQVTVPGGPAAFSPNGTILSISFSDRDGNPVTTFPTLIPIEMKYNAADVGQANGNANSLTAAYVLDANSPAIENPNGFPVGTFVLFPPQNVSLNTTAGTITASTQALGSTISVVTNPVGYVQTLQPDTPQLSSFDPATSMTFGAKPQFSYLQVVEPQIGDRLLVLDPDTGNYSYVDATSVGPSGPPPAKSSSAVVRGLLEPPGPPAG